MIILTTSSFLGFPGSSSSNESACNSGEPGLIPGSARSPGEGIGCPLQYSWASLAAQTVKNLLRCRRPKFDSWVGKIPWRRKWQSTLVFLPEKSHGQRSLVSTVHGFGKSWTWLSNWAQCIFLNWVQILQMINLWFSLKHVVKKYNLVFQMLFLLVPCLQWQVSSFPLFTPLWITRIMRTQTWGGQLIEYYHQTHRWLLLTYRNRENIYMHIHILSSSCSF